MAYTPRGHVATAMFTTESISFSTTQPVDLQVDSLGNLKVTGSFAASFPATQNVSGTVGAVIQNWPAIIGVSASFTLPVFNAGTVGVSGSVSITNSQISVDNFPSTQNVSGTVTSNVTVTGSTGLHVSFGDQGMSGSVGINQFYGVPALAGGVAQSVPSNQLSNLPWTVSLTGSLSASNFQELPLKSDYQGNLATKEQFAPVAEDNFNGVIATALLPVTASAYAPTFSGSMNILPGGAVPAVIKASPGVLYKAWMNNRSSGSVYLQLFNSTTTPAAAAVPLYAFIIVPTSISATQVCASEPVIDLSPFGAFFSTGIAVAVSTTQGTYTQANNYGTGQASFDTAFQYK